MPVTQQDIADKLKITRTTVARALNQSGPVDSELRRKILETAQEMGYQVNIHARSLSKKRGILVDVFLLAFYEESFLQNVVAGIRKAEWEATSYGMQVSIHMISPNDAQDQVRMMQEAIECKKTDAVVFTPHSGIGLESFLQYCQQNDILVGTLDIVTESNLLDFHVGPDYFSSGYIAAGMALRAIGNVYGTKKFLLFTRSDEFDVSQRGNGFLTRMQMREDIQIIKILFDFDARQLPDMAKMALNAHKDIAGIYSVIKMDDILTLLSDADKQRIALVSNDLSERNRKLLKMGLMDAVIYHRPVFQGYTAMKTIVDLLVKDRQLENRYIETYTDIIIQENAETFNESDTVSLVF